jgi:branched-chain amino acid aminotransferase
MQNPVNAKSLINVNGELLRPEEAKVSVFDRGFLYGDSLYEVVRSYDGRFFGLREHLERLEKSAALCRMVLTQPLETYAREIERAFLQFRGMPGNETADAYCRLIVTRGAGRIGFGLDCIETPTQYVIILQPIAPFTAGIGREKFEKGLNLKISARLRNDPRALDPAAKTGNYMNSLLAYLDAAAEGFDDALMCNADGHLTEGTTFNLFYVRRGVVATPPLDIGILDGITRTKAIEVARELGIQVREVRFPRERLHEADEAFISSSIKEVFPITRIDGKKIGSGKPGPVTRKLAEALRRRIEAELAAGARAGA